MAGYRDYRSPRGVHVDTHFDPPLDEEDESPVYYAPSPHRNRYSRSNQTPRIRDVNWMTASQNSVASPGPQTPHAYGQWTPAPVPPPQPVDLPTPIFGRASPARTEHDIGEHMAIDGVEYGDYEEDIGHEPPRKSGTSRFVGGFIKGLKKFPRFHLHRASGSSHHEKPPELTDWPPQRSNESLEYLDIPVPQPAPPPPAATPSPHVRPASVGAVSGVGAPSVHNVSPHRSPVVLAPMMMPAPSQVSSSSEASSSPSPLLTGRLSHVAPGTAGRRSHEEASHSFPEPTRPVMPILVTGEPSTQFVPIPPAPAPAPSGQVTRPPTTHIQPHTPISDYPSRNSIGFQIHRFHRFLKDLGNLPWISESQIADEYIPGQNTRGRMREQMRKGSEPSWYNPRPTHAPQPAYVQWQREWDPYAQHSAASLGNGMTGHGMATTWPMDTEAMAMGSAGGEQGGMRYPHGYTPQPVFLYPSGFPPPGVFGDPLSR